MNKEQQKSHLAESSSCYSTNSNGYWQTYGSKIRQYKACAALVVLLSGSLSLFGCATAPTTSNSQVSGGIGVPTTERTLAQRLLDESIEHTAQANIYALDETLRNNSRISINSFYSEVLLTGEVPNAKVKEEITKIISSMPDVKNLYNRLNVSRVKGSSYTLHDGYITSKVVTKILVNRQIKNSQVKIVTDDGIVYALGRLTPSQQGSLIEIVNDTVGVKELVLLTTLVDDNGVILTKDRIIQEPELPPPSFNESQPAYPQSNSNIDTLNHAPITNIPASNSNSSRQSDTSSPYIELYKNQVSE